ncbi:MAG: phasin family protein [Parvibaculum sp.]
MAEKTTPKTKAAKPAAAKKPAAKKPAVKAAAKKPVATKASKPAARPAAETAAPKPAKAEQTRQVEVIARILTELARTNFEETVEAARAVVRSGSLKKAIELQGKLVRATLKRNVAATREINKIAGDSLRHIAAPITERIGDALSNFRK